MANKIECPVAAPGPNDNVGVGIGYQSFLLGHDEAIKFGQDIIEAAKHSRELFNRTALRKGDWYIERASGYDGFGCVHCGTWRYAHEKLICDCR